MIAGIACIALGIALPPAPAMAQEARPKAAANGASTTSTVHFATNRHPTPPQTMFGIKWRHEFGKDRGTKLQYGLAEVSLPASRAPYTVPRPTFISARAALAKHVVVTSVASTSKDEFFRSLRGVVAGQSQQRLIVFVHGFNTGFADPIPMLGAIVSDIAHPVVMFSWPSQNSTINYQADQTAAEWSQSDLGTLLREIATELHGTSITLAAHSLGTRMAMAALKDLSVDVRGAVVAQAIDELVLAAPDFDAATFSRDYARLTAGRSVSLFFSQGDIALGMSRQFHRADRLGNTPPHKLELPEHVSKVDLSALRSNWLGHSYHRSAIYLTRELQGRFPAGRVSLERFKMDIIPMRVGNSRYWRVEPHGR